ncbi:MAG: hypothetical protein GY757_02205, partial [bacterium]|nr:hypothetical protein [bacterium]
MKTDKDKNRDELLSELESLRLRVSELEAAQARKNKETGNKETDRDLLTAIKDAEDAKKEAENANRTKSEFMTNMSHELRTPLNGVIGMTCLLLETGLDEEQKEYAGIVKDSADSLLAVINEILDFSRIESGSLDLEMLNFDIHNTVDNIIDVLTIRAREKELELSYLVSPE